MKAVKGYAVKFTNSGNALWHWCKKNSKVMVFGSRPEAETFAVESEAAMAKYGYAYKVEEVFARHIDVSYVSERYQTERK